MKFAAIMANPHIRDGYIWIKLSASLICLVLHRSGRDCLVNIKISGLWVLICVRKREAAREYASVFSNGKNRPAFTFILAGFTIVFGITIRAMN